MSEVQITEANVHAFTDVPDRWFALTDKRLTHSALRAITIVGGISGSFAYAYLSKEQLGPNPNSVTDWIMLVVMNLLPQGICAIVTGFFAIVFLRLVNKALAKPLNEPAIAAIAGGLTLLATLGIPLLYKQATMNFGGSEASKLSFDTLLVIWVNAFVIQFFVRLWIANTITKHNQKPYALNFTCPACHTNFQIWQLMAATTIIAILMALASALGFTEMIHVMLGSILFLAIGTTFVPAKALAEKLIPLPIQTADQIETQPDQNEALKNAAPCPKTYYTNGPVNTWKATYGGASGIAIAGMHFAVVFTIMLTVASLNESGNISGVTPVFALPGAFVGFILAGFFGLVAVFILTTLNAFFGNKVTAGNVAAVAGGLTGLACSLLIVESWSLLHWSPSDCFYDLQDFNNLFPLVAIFIATAMGQIYPRVYVKRCLHTVRHRPEVVALTATGSSKDFRMPVRAALLTLLSAAALMLMPADLPYRLGCMLFVATVGCMAMAWPLGCWVARLVDQRWCWESS